MTKVSEKPQDVSYYMIKTNNFRMLIFDGTIVDKKSVYYFLDMNRTGNHINNIPEEGFIFVWETKELIQAERINCITSNIILYDSDYIKFDRLSDLIEKYLMDDNHSVNDSKIKNICRDDTVKCKLDKNIDDRSFN